MSALSRDSATHQPVATKANFRLTPVPPIPDQAARDRFIKRREAGRLAETLAQVVGRSSSETGTARLATLLAADAGVLLIAKPAAKAAEIAGVPTATIVTRLNGSARLPVNQ